MKKARNFSNILAGWQGGISKGLIRVDNGVEEGSGG